MTIGTEVVRMKKILSFLMILMLVFSVCAFAETNDNSNPEQNPAEAAEEGDDSVQQALDILEEDDTLFAEDAVEIRAILDGNVAPKAKSPYSDEDIDKMFEFVD